MTTSQLDVNLTAWGAGNYVDFYAERGLRPAEAVLLLRYREPLSGRTLEVGCGAGRLLGYLCELSDQAHGLDLNPAMVEYCRRAYPNASVEVGDLRDLSAYPQGPLDAIFASFNVIDVLDDADRRSLLTELRGLLSDRGVLIFSSHNLASIQGALLREDGAGAPDAGAGMRLAGIRALVHKVMNLTPNWALYLARRAPRMIRNRRRLRPLERREGSYAIVNDPAHDYALLHYYIRRDDQELQLRELGYELLECVDLEGRTVPTGAHSDSPELHYVARAAASEHD